MNSVQIRFLHLVVPGTRTDNQLPLKMVEAQSFYPDAIIKLWEPNEWYACIRDKIGEDIVSALGTAPLKLRGHLASWYLLHLFGGVVVDCSITMLSRWAIPERNKVAAFVAPINDANWMGLHAGLLWSEANRPEWLIAVNRLMSTCMGSTFTDGRLSPIVEESLAFAFATVSAGRRHDCDLEDQWIGDSRVITSDCSARDVALVSPDRALIAIAQDNARAGLWPAPEPP